ncbi:60S ribosomal protein L23 [Trifolium medium]|uniref:60S ribosomal protein L23 n=1 Tax=Trifolium medium TaxID=97028 RepID=A0A392MB07_9FABA|nr:60S ribosomal protein L23 [Trifolium medium]
MIEEVDKDKLARITMILWSLWWRRNQKCWNDKIPTIFDVIRRARDSHQEWLKAKLRHTMSDHGNTTSVNYCWSKPSAGKLKCNVDTAYYKEDNVYCVGMCIRDENGKFVQAYTKRMQGTPTIVEAEAIGLKETLRWLWHNYRTDTDIEVEMDCLQVVQAIHSTNNNNTELGSMISMCRKLLSLNKNCKVSYISSSKSDSS